jgi:hypothetical protein
MMLFLGIFVLISTTFSAVNANPPDSIVLLEVRVDPCPRGWTYLSQINECYIIPKLFLPWSEASAYCQNVTGGTLVSIYSQFEYDQLLIQVRASEYGKLYPFWLGLQPYSFYPYWKWQDQHTPNFTKWIDNSRPNSTVNPCVGWKTTNDDGWKSINCKYAQPFICKQHSNNCQTTIINGTSGNLTSPNYPDVYDLNATCIYHINVPNGYVVKLTFDVMDIDLLADLYIYDGPNLQSELIGDIYYDYWYYYSMTYTSTESYMTLQFKTGSWLYEGATGWTASFKAVTAPAPTMFNGTSGSLTSPNYPSNYTSGDTQYYKFFAPKNHRLIITVWDFVTEAGYDWLQIYDGEFANSGTPLLDWAGNKSALVPKILTTTTNAASLVWYTDFAKTYRGYNLTWVAENYFG